MNHLTPSSAESDLVMKLRHFHNDGSFYSRCVLFCTVLQRTVLHCTVLYRCLVVASLSKIGNTNTFPRNSGHGSNIITTIGTVAEQFKYHIN